MANSLITPEVLTQPIAENGDKNSIPVTNDQSLGQMSQSTGFPPITSTRIADGGKAPRRADFNGAFNLLSQQHFFLQNGGSYTFRQDVSDAIGGYPLNAMLYYTDSDGSTKIVRSLIQSNTFNFVTNPEYIDDGVHWQSVIPTQKWIEENVVTHNNISNCITEIPQDIKVELNGYELTVKAGSKLYVPNGSGNYDEVITDTDITARTMWTTNQVYVFIKPDTKTPYTIIPSNVFSGTSAPSSPSNGCIWYDTTNNVIKRYADSTWTGGLSFPVCLASMVNGTGITSVDRVFNGVGYFGSTVYVLPNTKFLIPNGKNEDGSNNNIEYTETSVRPTTKTTYEDYPDMFFGTDTFYNNRYLGESFNPPEVKNYSLYYNISENKMYSSSNRGYWSEAHCVHLGQISVFSSNIREANILNSFQAVDLNRARTVVASYKSGNDWYRIWSDGWKEQGGELKGTIANTFTHTFLVPFTQRPTVLHTQVTVYASCGYIYRISVLELTKISFANYTGYSTTGNGKNGYIGWYACGY